MILYPTETIYGLGVNALDEAEIAKLFRLKGRAEGKSVSWLVRDLADIEQYAEVGDVTAKIAERFLPGPVTLVLPARATVPRELHGSGDTVSFRISADPIAQQLIADFMAEYNAPLTCTSANVSGASPENTPEAILAQFGDRASLIDRVLDDGPRSGVASIVVKVVGDSVEIIREGAISAADIRAIV